MSPFASRPRTDRSAEALWPGRSGALSPRAAGRTSSKFRCRARGTEQHWPRSRHCQHQRQRAPPPMPRQHRMMWLPPPTTWLPRHRLGKMAIWTCDWVCGSVTSMYIATDHALATAGQASSLGCRSVSTCPRPYELPRSSDELAHTLCQGSSGQHVRHGGEADEMLLACVLI